MLIVLIVYDLFLTSISIFLLFLFYLLNVNNHTRLLGWTTWPVKGGNTIQRNHHCDKGTNNRYNLLILFSIVLYWSSLVVCWIISQNKNVYSKQGVTLHWEHVFDFFFLYSQYYRIKALLMLMYMKIVIQCFVCLFNQEYLLEHK